MPIDSCREAVAWVVVQGSIRQRSKGGFEVRVYLGRDLVTGRQRYASRTVRGGKCEAQRVMREMITAADAGTFGRVDTTVGHLLERWFEQTRTELSPDRLTETGSYLDHTVLPGIGHLPLAKSAQPRWTASTCRRQPGCTSASEPPGDTRPRKAIPSLRGARHPRPDRRGRTSILKAIADA